MLDAREERPTLVPAPTKVDTCGQQMDVLPCIPIERKKKQTTKTSVLALALKSLINSTSLASE